MKQIWKNFLKRVLPIAMSFAMLMVFSASALADSGKSGHESGKPDWAGEQSDDQNKDRDQNKERDQNQERDREREHKDYRGISTEKIAMAIESVTDEATKAELTAMLDAYILALTNKDAALSEGGMSLSELSHAASDARSALKDALEEAGFTLGSVLGWQEWKDYGLADDSLDLEGIALAIAALDDTDLNKETLATLLTAYQDALAALDTATDTDEDALKESADAARDALLEALILSGLYPVTLPGETVDPTLPVT